MPDEEEEIQTKPLAATITPLVQREAMPEEEEVQAKTLSNSIQREAIPEEEEEPIQAKLIQREAMPGEEEEIQAKRSSGSGFEAGGDFESRLSSSKSGGSPLPDDVRSFMEPRFGADFSGVRVHTGSEAVQMNREVGAQAFAHGQDVYFGAGKMPGNDALTAHELTHVVQQTNTIGTKPNLHPSNNNESSNVSRQFTAQIQRKFIAKGDVKGFKQLINPIISGTGTEVKINIAPQGNVSLSKSKKVRKAGPPIREASVLASLLEKVINDSKTVRISFTNGSSQVMGGNYDLSEIDLEDVWAFGADSKEAMSAMAILAHEIEEQYQKQVNGKGFGGKDRGAHGEALKAEAEASGAVRENEYSKDLVKNDDGTINEKKIFIYRYPDGSLVEVVATFDHGHIVDVQRNKKE
jgi:hypothetical protein